MKKITLSICIPTYEMRGEALRVLTRSFDMLKKQTFKDFEVVISDNSEDSIVKNLCESPEYGSLHINYLRNPRKGMAPNTNEAIKHAKGEIIKILYMDDFLANENSLKEIAENFKGQWLVTGCEHYDGSRRYNLHYPKYNKKIYRGKNTIGSPSVLSIRNDHPLLFDENMTWLLDCDYYKRMHDMYGEPEILNGVNVVIGTGKHQITNILSSWAKKKERYYMAKKYKKELLYWLGLW
ncbi:MAG: glycosyltransferase [Patescibacteria group bacterium]